MARKKRENSFQALDKDFRLEHTETMLQLSGNSQLEAAHASLVDLRKGDAAILDRIDLPTEDARRLMELGFVPGCTSSRDLAPPAAIRASSRWMVRKSPCGATLHAA